MDFSMFTDMCNAAHLIVEHFYYLKKKTFATTSIPLYLPTRNPLATTDLFSVFID